MTLIFDDSRRLLCFSKLGQTSDSLFLVLFLANPELVAILHYVCQHRAAEKDHVLLPGRVFDFNFEFLMKKQKGEILNFTRIHKIRDDYGLIIIL